MSKSENTVPQLLLLLLLYIITCCLCGNIPVAVVAAHARRWYVISTNKIHIGVEDTQQYQ